MYLFHCTDGAMNMYSLALCILNVHISRCVTALTFVLTIKRARCGKSNVFCADKARHSCYNDKSNDNDEADEGMKASETSVLSAWLIKRSSDQCGPIRMGPGRELPFMSSLWYMRWETDLSLRQPACHMSPVRIMWRKALTSAAPLHSLLSCQPFL